MKRVVLLALLLLAGCGGAPTEDAGPGNIKRWRDPDYRVTCWTAVYRLSCLPERDVVAR